MLMQSAKNYVSLKDEYLAEEFRKELPRSN